MSPSPTLRELKRLNFVAYESLKHHIGLGGKLKSVVLTILIELQRFEILVSLPIIGGLLKTSRGLVFGHVTESNLNLPRSTSGQANTPRPEIVDNQYFDSVVIGSGPGGAVAASILESRGTLLVIEKGIIPLTPHGAHHSLSHVLNDFRVAGQEVVLSGNLPQFAQGSVLGGGAEVNSGLYHKLPNSNVDVYLESLNITRNEWVEAENYIHDWLSPEEMNVNADDSLIATGARENGLEYKNIPRWRSYSSDQSYVHRGMNETFWNNFIQRNPDSVVTNMEVLKIINKNSSYIVLKVKDLSSGEIKHLRAGNVHVSGGSISTPYLLARSGLIRWMDTRFQWHPMIRVLVKTSQEKLGAGDIDPFQAWTSDRSIKLGSAVSTPSLLAVSLSREITERESQAYRSYYASYSSTGRGGLIPGTQTPWYLHSKRDKELARQSFELLKTILSSPRTELINVAPNGYKKESTVHIFGTLPVGSDIYIKGTNRLRKDSRIFVSDGSILPHGPGVNPQAVIMSCVHALLKGSFE